MDSFFKFLLSDRNVTLLGQREILCTDPDHNHAGKLESIAVEIAGHKFDITKDRGYNVSHNENDAFMKVNLKREQVLEFIDDCLA